MEFFEVTAKCGHVGKGQYYEGLFYVRAESGRAAAALVRQNPRVKHDHKDAILGVLKIGCMEFKLGQAAYRNNPYFNCHSVQDQRLHFEEIADKIVPESPHKRERCRREDRQAKFAALRKFSRKMNKYGYNNYDIGA
jgi:hypothetical protein